MILLLLVSLSAVPSISEKGCNNFYNNWWFYWIEISITCSLNTSLIESISNTSVIVPLQDIYGDIKGLLDEVNGSNYDTNDLQEPSEQGRNLVLDQEHTSDNYIINLKMQEVDTYEHVCALRDYIDDGYADDISHLLNSKVNNSMVVSNVVVSTYEEDGDGFIYLAVGIVVFICICLGCIIWWKCCRK